MNKIERIREQRQQAQRQLLEMDSRVYKSFLKMEEVAFANGALTKKTKELIAVSISVVAACEPCMEWHVTQALGCGASKEELLEAIEVAMEMADGPATVSARFALEVMQAGS